MARKNSLVSRAAVMGHVFHVGQLVRLKERLLDSGGIYEIIRLLPSGLEDEPMYRVKAVNGPMLRLVREEDIVPA
jgi:hypothetical protein